MFWFRVRERSIYGIVPGGRSRIRELTFRLPSPALPQTVTTRLQLPFTSSSADPKQCDLFYQHPLPPQRDPLFLPTRIHCYLAARLATPSTAPSLPPPHCFTSAAPRASATHDRNLRSSNQRDLRSCPPLPPKRDRVSRHPLRCQCDLHPLSSARPQSAALSPSATRHTSTSAALLSARLGGSASDVASAPYRPVLS